MMINKYHAKLTYYRIITWIFLLALLESSCSISKEALDKSTVERGLKNANTIKELADYALSIAIDKKQTVFRTDTLKDKTIKEKFNSNGYGGLVTVTFKNRNNSIISGQIDSTVIFKQTTLRGVTEIIYDFALKKRILLDDKSNPQQSVFLNITHRIYYRRRPVPMM